MMALSQKQENTHTRTHIQTEQVWTTTNLGNHKFLKMSLTTDIPNQVMVVFSLFRSEGSFELYLHSGDPSEFHQPEDEGTSLLIGNKHITQPHVLESC